jgi:glycosyltransferase involved in cell wall biosynthesis
MPYTTSLDSEFAADEPTFLSVIIPAYNEERRLANNLKQVMEYFGAQNYTSEVILVDDGSSDRTPEIVKELEKEYCTLRLMSVAHGGKGHACKQGVFSSRGQWLFLCDSDLSMPIKDFSKFIPLFQDNCHIAIASREVPGARRYGEPAYRHLMGRVFNWVVRILAVRGIQDTQCGFKCFRSDVAKEIFDVQTINGWGFDVEILFIAQKRGYRIAEVPIDWYYRSHSKVRPIQDAINMFREVWRVRLNNWRGYYDER